jgi:hypothetical protein
MHLTSVSLWLVVSEPVLKKRSVEWGWAEGVESETLTSVDNSQLTGHGKNSTLGSGVCQLRGGRTDKGDDGGSVDDGTLGLLVLAHGDDSVLATVPDTLNVDVLGEVPDLLWGVDSIGVISVHDTSVVEHDIDTTPGIKVVNKSLDISLLGNVTDLDLSLVGGWNKLLQLSSSLLKSWLRDIGEENVSTLLGEEDTGLETNSTR